MSNTDTETTAAPTPVQASNASAALPGAGGASAAYGGSGGAAPADASSAPAAAPAPSSEPYATITTPTQVGVPNPRSRPALLGQESRSKDDYAADDAVVQPQPNGLATIEYNIVDRTSAKGMQPQAVAQLNAAAEYAGQAGLARIVVVSGRGPGHKSHGGGTEWDLMGYNADGSKWTREQRVAVAAGARSAGATRFGFYEYGKSFPTADGRLHIGYRGPAATWGAGGYTGGAKSRAYTNEAERAFSTAFYAGQDFDLAPYINAPRTMTAEAQNQPGTTAYAGDPFGVSASKAAMGVPNPPTRPVPVSALAFAESQPDAADPTRQVLSTAALSTTVLESGRILDRGSRGAAATEWQTFLNMHGFTAANGQQLVVDGNFGRRTREATKAYQEWAQIGVDGRVGPETLSAALYTLDPSSAPLPGKVAYDDGAVAAKKIIAPAEVDMPTPRLRPAAVSIDIALPRQRPERGAGVPNPRLRPREPADLTPDEIDELTRVDEAGNYIVAPTRRPADMTDTRDEAIRDRRRSDAWANLEAFRRTEAATKAGAGATRQRLQDARTKDDRFRPPARDTRTQDEIMLIRSSEAVREFARGVGDSYRQVIDRSRYQTIMQEADEVSEQVQKQIDDALLRANPTPADVVTEAYSFGPQSGGINAAIMRDMSIGPTDAGRKNAAKDLRRRMEEAGVYAGS